MQTTYRNTKILDRLIFCLALIILACSEDDSVSPKSTQSAQDFDLSEASKQGSGSRNSNVVLIDGVGFYAEPNECDYPSRGADYALRMTGDLEGCLYAFIEEHDCRGDGVYYEKGREIFIGTYMGKTGSFQTTYRFQARYEGCGEDGFPTGAELFGICQHPIVDGSGTGDFTGVTGRLDFRDDVQALNFPYFGHLKF